MIKHGIMFFQKDLFVVRLKRVISVFQKLNFDDFQFPSEIIKVKKRGILLIKALRINERHEDQKNIFIG